MSESRVDRLIQLAEAAMPVPTANIGYSVPETEALDSGNTLFMQHHVPAGTRGSTRKTTVDVLTRMLFGRVSEATLVLDGLPFHGCGANIREAEEDLVVSMEETLDELQADIEDGVELSPHLARTLGFVRLVFGIPDDLEGC